MGQCFLYGKGEDFTKSIIIATGPSGSDVKCQQLLRSANLVKSAEYPEASAQDASCVTLKQCDLVVKSDRVQVTLDVTASADTKGYWAPESGLISEKREITLKSGKQTIKLDVVSSGALSLDTKFFCKSGSDEATITAENVQIKKITPGKEKIVSEKSGTWTYRNIEIGLWAIQASLEDQKSTNEIEVPEFGVYRVPFSYFSATIPVKYPAGSTCTCAKGDRVFTAPDTSGQYDFVVDSAGEWTVSCTNGNKHYSKNVEITENGQRVEVTLAYILYIFKEGEGQKVPLTAKSNGDRPWTVGTSSINMPWANSDGFVYTTSEVDLRGYDTLNFEMKIDNKFDTKRRKCGVRSSPPVSEATDYTFLASVTLPNAVTARKTYSVDIQSVSNGYVTIKGVISAVAYNIWAE